MKQVEITDIKKTEEQEQAALIQWHYTYMQRYPELKMLFAIQNERICSARRGKKFNDLGRKKGVPDLMLAVTRLNSEKASGIDSGLFIEMKVGKNKLSKSQEVWKDRLIKSNYAYKVCYSWIDAAKAIQKYLELPKIKED